MEMYEAYELLLEHIKLIRDLSKSDFNSYFIFEDVYMFPVNSEIFFSVNSNTGEIIRFFRKGLIDYQKMIGKDSSSYAKRLNDAYIHRQCIFTNNE